MKTPAPYSLPARLQRAYDLIAAQPRTQADLVALMDISQANVGTAIYALKAAEFIRIESWRRSPETKRLNASYGLGNDPDAERPAPMTPQSNSDRAKKVQAAREAREAARAAKAAAEAARARAIERVKRRGLNGHAAAVVDTMRECGDMTAMELADALGIALNLTRAMLSRLRYWRMVHISAWTRECPLAGVERKPLPVFALGNKRDAPPPAKMTKTERNRRYLARKSGRPLRPAIVSRAPASVFHLGAMMMQAGSEARA